MKPAQTHYQSIIGFLLFAAAALLVFTASFILALSVLFSYLSEGIVNVQSAIYSVTVFFTGAVLGIISAVSLLRFLNKPAAYTRISTTFEAWKIVAGLIGAGLALFIGNELRDNQSVNWLVLPLLTIPAVVLPIWTLAGLAIRDLSLGTRWRTWGAFGISLTVTPIILFLLESLVVIVIFFVVILYAVTNPEIAAEFKQLSSQFLFINLESETGMEQALRLMAPFLMKPGVILPAVIFLSVLVPLVEELIKPLVVWVLAAKLDSAAQGFAFGAMSGAGFALWESFNVSGQTAEWGIVLFTRIGTGLLHITTSALMGGAIFMAIRERRYLRLLGTYLLAVFLHGLWNASAITVSFSSLLLMYGGMANSGTLLWGSTIGLAILAAVLFALLITSNRRLHHSLQPSTPEEGSTAQNRTNV